MCVLFRCRECLDFFPLEEIKDGYVSREGVGACKYCVNIRNKALAIKRKMRGNEENYKFCKTCKRYMHRKRSAGQRTPQIEIEECKFCKSKEIEDAKP